MWEDEAAAVLPQEDSRSNSSAGGGGRVPLFVAPTGRTSPAGLPSVSITIPGPAARLEGVGAAGPSGGAPVGSAGSGSGRLKISAREFVPGSFGSFGSPGVGFSPPSSAAAAGAGAQAAPAAAAAASVPPGLRVAAHEFRPGGAPAGGAAAVEEPGEDPLLTHFVSGQLIPTNRMVRWLGRWGCGTCLSGRCSSGRLHGVAVPPRCSRPRPGRQRQRSRAAQGDGAGQRCCAARQCRHLQALASWLLPTVHPTASLPLQPPGLI